MQKSFSRVWGSGFRVQDVGLRVEGSGLGRRTGRRSRFSVSGSWVSGLDFGFRLQGGVGTLKRFGR